VVAFAASDSRLPRLLPVTRQDLTARSADSCPIALQAIEDAENVVVIVFDQLLAEAHDVGTAGRTLSRITLALRRSARNGHQGQCGRESKSSNHYKPLVWKVSATAYVTDTHDVTRRRDPCAGISSVV
jgi:hypothetical protein